MVVVSASHATLNGCECTCECECGFDLALCACQCVLSALGHWYQGYEGFVSHWEQLAQTTEASTKRPLLDFLSYQQE